jgi:hypothetical protein
MLAEPQSPHPTSHPMPQPRGPQQPLVAIATTPKIKNAKRTIICSAGDTAGRIKLTNENRRNPNVAQRPKLSNKKNETRSKINWGKLMVGP